MYQNYIFDFYGTLVDIRTNESKPYLWKKMSELYTCLGAAYTASDLKAEFRKLEKEAETVQIANHVPIVQAQKNESAEHIQKEAEEWNEQTVEVNLTEVFMELYRQKGVRCDAEKAKMTAVFFRTLSRQYLRIYDGVDELLTELRARGKGVYLLSNAQTDFTRPEIEMLGLKPYFDGIFISSEQGCRKPSPIFFKRLLETYGLNPAECIMIGNDEAADVSGAKAVGMDSLYIHTAISPEEYGKVEPTYRIMDGDFRKIRELVL